MKDVKINLGSKIRMLRELKGISQDSLARSLGLSQQAFQKIESGQTKIDIEKAELVATELGMELETLINFNPANYLYQCSQSGVFNTNQNHYNAEHIETIIKTKEELITALRTVISEKDSRIKLLEDQLKK
ncbi:MAG: helix-turn-helix domain-containing protein [Bacteroidota bacterium]